MYKYHAKLLLSKYAILKDLQNRSSFGIACKLNQNATASTTYLHITVRRLVIILNKNSHYASLRIILSITIS